MERSLRLLKLDVQRTEKQNAWNNPTLQRRDGLHDLIGSLLCLTTGTIVWLKQLKILLELMSPDSHRGWTSPAAYNGVIKSQERIDYIL